MIPPNWVIESIQKVHKHARLGWRGIAPKPGEEKELNKGFFYVLQLYHKRDAERSALSAPWKSEYGPIFGAPFDINSRVPMMVAKIEDARRVFSGSIIDDLKFWMVPASRRARESAKEAGKKYKSAVHELAEEAADYMLWHNSKNWQNQSSKRWLTNDDLTEEDKAVLRGETLEDLTEAFMPHEGSVV